MRPILMAAAALAMAAAPAAADAACKKRTTGTVVGALTGGLLGHTVAGRGDRTEGALIGGVVGGVAGNQLTKCKNNRTYSSNRSYRAASYRAPAARQTCRYETRGYYNPYGELVYAPVRVCGG